MSRPGAANGPRLVGDQQLGAEQDRHFFSAIMKMAFIVLEGLVPQMVNTVEQIRGQAGYSLVRYGWESFIVVDLSTTQINPEYNRVGLYDEANTYLIHMGHVLRPTEITYHPSWPTDAFNAMPCILLKNIVKENGMPHGDAGAARILQCLANQRAQQTPDADIVHVIRTGNIPVHPASLQRPLEIGGRRSRRRRRSRRSRKQSRNN
jgi:hypothetical protein